MDNADSHTLNLCYASVSFGRHHEFKNQQEVQEELTFAVQILSRQGSFLPSYTKLSNSPDIPFMALDGLGNRHVVAEGESEHSGKYIVEQVEVEGRMMRRLFFLNNPFLIQTEVAMREQGNDIYVVDPTYAAFDYHKAGEYEVVSATCAFGSRLLSKIGLSSCGRIVCISSIAG